MIKMISLIFKKPGLTDEEFRQHWREQHGPLVVKVVPGVKRYVQNHPLKKPGGEQDCDGIAEVWFDDFAAFDYFVAWRGTPEGKRLLDDEDEFVDRTRTVRYIVEEHEIP